MWDTKLKLGVSSIVKYSMTIKLLQAMELKDKVGMEDGQKDFSLIP